MSFLNKPGLGIVALGLRRRGRGSITKVHSTDPFYLD